MLSTCWSTPAPCLIRAFRPDYRKQAFQAHLLAAGFEYRYLGDVLGGKHVDPAAMRDGQLDLPSLYALPAFRAGLDEIEAAARAGRTPALMCAELRPAACHRYWMLAPPLVERGLEVLHIDEFGGIDNKLCFNRVPVISQPKSQASRLFKRSAILSKRLPGP
jgi:uncharacterized protein (DUF488 family)